MLHRALSLYAPVPINNNFKSRSSSKFSHICCISGNWPRLQVIIRWHWGVFRKWSLVLGIERQNISADPHESDLCQVKFWHQWSSCYVRAIIKTLVDEEIDELF